MRWLIVSILLALVYTLYIVFSQYLYSITDISVKKVFVNIILIAAICCLIAFPREVMIPQWNISYLLLLLIGFCLFFQNYLLLIGTKLPVNFGIIDGLAISIYLPLMTLALYCCFGEILSLRKMFGILLACLAGYFILV
jgi:drug/metabolite transporter (DMT)-like permease